MLQNVVENFTRTHPMFGSSKGKFGAMNTPVSSPSGKQSVYVLQDTSTEDMLLQIIQFIFITIAVYLAMKCKRIGNVNVAEIVAAVFFAPCYILFRFLRPCSVK